MIVFFFFLSMKRKKNIIDQINIIKNRLEIELSENSRNTILLSVIDLVKKFIIDNKRILYGGSCIEMYQDRKNVKRVKSVDIIDLDFYSPTPWTDAIRITNIIGSKFGWKYVSSTEAKHNETFRVYYRENIVADISYMPKYIFSKLPTQTINNFLLTDPTILIIDIYRQLSSNLTERIFKLEKIFPRGEFIKEFEITLPPPQYVDLKPHKQFKKLKSMLYQNLQNVLYLGFETYEAMMNRLGCKKLYYNQPIEIFTNNLYRDANTAASFLKSVYPDSILTQNEYFPFFQFRNISIEISLQEPKSNKSKVFIKLHRYPQGLSIPFYIGKESEPPAMVTYYYFLCNQWINLMHNKIIKKQNGSNQLQIISNLSSEYEAYNNRNNLLGIEPNHPFPILTLSNLYGDTKFTAWDHDKAMIMNKKIHFKRLRQRYDPVFGKININPDFKEPRYDNTSGNINEKK